MWGNFHFTNNKIGTCYKYHFNDYFHHEIYGITFSVSFTIQRFFVCVVSAQIKLLTFFCRMEKTIKNTNLMKQ